MSRSIEKYSEKDFFGESVLIENKEFAKVNKRLIRQQTIATTGISEIPKYSFKDYIGEDIKGNLDNIKVYIKYFDSKFFNKHLYFYSKHNSTQKSTTAKNVLTELYLNGKTAYFITMDAMVKILSNVQFNEDLEEEHKTLLGVDLLVIDDAFDPKKVTLYKSGYQLPFIDNFLRTRLEIKKKATIFTSNSTIEEIEKDFGKHLQQLVKRNCFPMEFRDSIKDFDVTKIFDDFTFDEGDLEIK